MNNLGKPWLGTPDCMIQYCPIQCEQELDSKLVFLVDTYGSAFDSNWWYYRTKLTKRNKLCRPIKRTPLWFRQKHMPTEKPKDPFQKKLTEI
jgi:hypothetical protein